MSFTSSAVQRANRTVVVALLAIVTAGDGFGQEYDFGPARQSITELESVAEGTRFWEGVVSAPLPAPYDRPLREPPVYGDGARSILTGRLGPGTFDVICSKPGDPIRNVKRYTYRLGDLGDPELKTIVSLVGMATKDSEAFTVPLRHWMKSTVPAISAHFDTAEKNILEAQGEVQREQGSVATQREKVSNNLAQVSGSVKAGAGEIEGLISQLAKYLTALKGYNRDLAVTTAKLDKKIQTGLQESRTAYLKATPCDNIEMQVCYLTCRTVRRSMGSDGFLDLERQVNQNFQLIQSTPDRIARLTAPADKAGSMLLGTMVNMLNRLNLVSAQLSKAQNFSSLNSAIEELHIRVAAQAWREFAAWAKKES